MNTTILNTTIETISTNPTELSDQDVFIAVLTPIAGIIIAIIGLISTIITYKSRKSSKCEEINLETEDGSTNISVQKFSEFMNDNNIASEHEGQIIVKDVMNVIETIVPILTQSKEYKNIKEFGAELNVEVIKEIVLTLIQMVLGMVNV